jgi:hypothetical protein
MSGLSRRAALRAGGLALATAAFAPAAAQAKSDEGGILLGLWRREMGASLAYDKVAHVDPLLVTLRSHEADHAAAIATELAAVGLGTPPPPEQPADLDILAELLAAAGHDRLRVFDAAISLEQNLGKIYRTALPALPDVKIAMTAATILASHAQHLLILRQGR